TIAIRAALERHTGRLHHVQLGLDVGLAPRRPRMPPAARGLDEVVRFARGAADGVVDLGLGRGLRGEERRYCGGEQRDAQRRFDWVHGRSWAACGISDSVKYLARCGTSIRTGPP